MKFFRVEQSPSFPELEKKVGARWKEEKTFEQSLERTKNGPEFIFYDGPPFPTGSPHHGTLFVTILKDLIPRYKTMRGYYVPRGWGWDCHGLPVETQAEKNLGITDKTDIEKKFGVKTFNDECRRIVSECNEAWKIYIERIGRWVDFDHPYRTLDRDFMESVIWAFSESYKKGLIYRDYRVSPYCYRCQTALSISDTRLDDSTRPRQERTITVKFPVLGKENTYFLAWTTTPWTLPSNLALAVGANISYSIIKAKKDIFILATDCIKTFEKELGQDLQIMEEVTGAELINRGYKYRPIFPYFESKSPEGFPVLIGDFVTTDEGTGIVHIAPAFGEDDYWLCKRNGVTLVNPVDGKGCFSSEVSDFEGKNVHDANPEIIRFLKDSGIVFKEKTVEHNYPHCWRCRMPLIYRALDAWYYNIDAIKDRLLANNEAINWYPATVKEGRFGNWIENARDWNITRNRYWATPIPVWECESCKEIEVLGSAAEIEAKGNCKLPDLHKEYLDNISFSCKCGGQMKHLPEVLDGWFESGSMPYGQFHYPFERSEHFESHFPCDFIVEYTAQIRGWFYVMHVLATGLFDKPAFRNCMVHGTLLAADGKKMSKSQKNYTDPLVLLDNYGADAFRAYLLSSNAVQMADLAFKDEGIENMVRTINLPLWNALLFFSTYAEIDGIDSTELGVDPKDLPLSEVDTFILSELELLIKRITEQLDQYLINEAAKELPEFLDTLNNWFIRRSRQRVWASEPRGTDKMV
ncbi:MAG: isoleucine--tRNA ligase, partial [SAR324 cluster bacterium]|nr:isoleucine--tRNA ligase [SAR324 cluster bacterium]